MKQLFSLRSLVNLVKSLTKVSMLFGGLAVFLSYAVPRLEQTLRELQRERQREERARADAERHSREADELRRLSQALTHTTDPTAAAQRVADAVKRLFDPSIVAVRLLEPDGTMVAVAISGDNPVVVPGHRMPPGSGVSGSRSDPRPASRCCKSEAVSRRRALNSRRPARRPPRKGLGSTCSPRCSATSSSSTSWPSAIRNTCPISSSPGWGWRFRMRTRHPPRALAGLRQLASATADAR